MEIPTPACALVRNDNVVRGALPSANSNFSAQQNDTERVRLGAITDHVRYDLAARPAGKFPICRAIVGYACRERPVCAGAFML